jgi:hypothetical protein
VRLVRLASALRRFVAAIGGGGAEEGRNALQLGPPLLPQFGRLWSNHLDNFSHLRLLEVLEADVTHRHH